MIAELRRSIQCGVQRCVIRKFAVSNSKARCGGPIQFRVAETPIFVSRALLEDLAEQGAALALHLIGSTKYLDAARRAIPQGYEVANETPHPNFLTADFALVRSASGELVPRLVEIQAFPSVFAYQAELCSAYREVFDLPSRWAFFLAGSTSQLIGIYFAGTDRW